MRPRPPSSPLFPYTTLFRSRLGAELGAEGGGGAVKGGLGRPGGVGLDGVGEELGQGGVVAGGQAELELAVGADVRSEEHTSELQSQSNLVCRLLLEKKNTHW